MIRSLLVITAAVGVGLVACGGAIAPDPAGSGGTGTPPGPTTTATSTPTGGPTSTSVPPTPPSPPPDSGGTPPSAACARTADRFVLTVDGLGHHDTCAGPEHAPLAYEVSGELVDVRADALVIDTCGPTADCGSTSLVTIGARAAGLDLSDLSIIRVRSLVRAQLTFNHYFGCTSTIVVTSLAEWKGEKNPIDAGGVTYLVGADGGLSVPGAPFTVERVGHGCMPGARSCSLNAPDVYSLRFVGWSDTQTLEMGEQRWFGPTPGQFLTIRNLRSFNDGVCDADFDWGFFAVRSLGKGV